MSKVGTKLSGVLFVRGNVKGGYHTKFSGVLFGRDNVKGGYQVLWCSFYQGQCQRWEVTKFSGVHFVRDNVKGADTISDIYLLKTISKLLFRYRFIRKEQSQSYRTVYPAVHLFHKQHKKSVLFSFLHKIKNTCTGKM